MFLHNKVNEDYTRVQLVENRRGAGCTSQRQLASLGRRNELQASGRLDELLKSGGRFAQDAAVIAGARNWELDQVQRATDRGCRGVPSPLNRNGSARSPKRFAPLLQNASTWVFHRVMGLRASFAGTLPAACPAVIRPATDPIGVSVVTSLLRGVDSGMATQVAKTVYFGFRRSLGGGGCKFYNVGTQRNLTIHLVWLGVLGAGEDNGKSTLP